MSTKVWQPIKIEETLVDNHARWIAKSEHAPYLDRLVATPLPAGIKVYITPNDEETCAYARKTMQRWFWRHFGGDYVETRQDFDQGGHFIEMHRGTKWYDPKMRAVKMANYQKKDYTLRRKNNGTQRSTP